MKLLHKFAVLTFISSASLLAQEANTTRATATPFCTNDPRPEVRAFCDPLSRLQEFVNSSPKGQDSRDLNQLDLANPSANSKFIRVAAGRSAVENLVEAV